MTGKGDFAFDQGVAIVINLLADRR